MRKITCHKCGALKFQGKPCECLSINKRIEKKSIPLTGKYKDSVESNSRRWRMTRAEILNRDDFHCIRCEIKFGIIETSDLTVHHIIPRKLLRARADYNEDMLYDKSNLITLCKICNSQLGLRKLDFKYKVPDIEEVEYFL